MVVVVVVNGKEAVMVRVTETLSGVLRSNYDYVIKS